MYLSSSVLDLAALVGRVQSPSRGGIACFVGTVRDHHGGRSVVRLDYSAYAAMAELELERILDEAEQRFDVHSLIVEHRTGRLELGDVSVALVVAHEHRAPALDCTRFVIEEIKKRVPIWKMEHYEDGTREWVDPTRAAETSRA